MLGAREDDHTQCLVEVRLGTVQVEHFMTALPPYLTWSVRDQGITFLSGNVGLAASGRTAPGSNQYRWMGRQS